MKKFTRYRVGTQRGAVNMFSDDQKRRVTELDSLRKQSDFLGTWEEGEGVNRQDLLNAYFVPYDAPSLIYIITHMLTPVIFHNGFKKNEVFSLVYR